MHGQGQRTKKREQKHRTKKLTIRFINYARTHSVPKYCKISTTTQLYRPNTVHVLVGPLSIATLSLSFSVSLVSYQVNPNPFPLSIVAMSLSISVSLTFSIAGMTEPLYQCLPPILNRWYDRASLSVSLWFHIKSIQTPSHSQSPLLYEHLS